jgi:hypothetical protein
MMGAAGPSKDAGIIVRAASMCHIPCNTARRMRLGTVTTAISAGNVPGQASHFGAGDDAQGTTRSAAKFEQALAQTPVGGAALSETERLSGSAPSSSAFPVPAGTLIAADDAWVEFLAVSEQLQNPQLLPEEKDQLLKGLTERWRSFMSQSEPIVRQLEEYIAREAP